MVDYDSYFQYARAEGRNGALEPANAGPGCMCSDCQGNEGLDAKYRFRFERNAKNKDWEDEQYLICPPRVLGYVLEAKEWAQLQVTTLTWINMSSKKDTSAEFRRLRLADDADEDAKPLRNNRKRRGKPSNI